MPRIARIVVPGCPHHITQRGNRRQRTFFEDRDFQRYLALLAAVKARLDVDIWAYCLMPNHVHFVAVPHSTHSLATLFGRVHHRYARSINERREWQGHLWQQRFHSTPMDEEHLIAAVRYVELNPVRAGLCEHAEDWTWSSARAHLGKVPDPLLSTEPMLKRVNDWRSYLAEESTPHLTESLRRNTRSGRPAGSNAFIESAEVLTGRQLRRGKSSRESWSLAVDLPQGQEPSVLRGSCRASVVSVELSDRPHA